MKFLYTLIIALFFAGQVWATPRGETKRGNLAAEKSQFDQALTHYKQALEQKGDTSVILYDLGNVMTQSGQFENAEKSYLGSLRPGQPLPEQSETFYNLGNSYFGQQKYDQAAQAYIESLKRNPQDEAAKYNLELARRMLQQQQQQQQQQDDQQQEKPEDQKKQEQQQQDQKQDEQQQQEQPQNQQEQQQDQQQQPPQPDKQMSKEEAEKILNALLQNEQDALKQAKKMQVKSRAKREKDW